MARTAPVTGHYGNYHITVATMGSGKKGRRREYYEEDDGDVDNNGIGGSSGKKVRREGFYGYSYGAGGSGSKGYCFSIFVQIQYRRW